MMERMTDPLERSEIEPSKTLLTHIVLQLHNSHDALEVAERLMENGYTVRVGPMSQMDNGIRVDVFNPYGFDHETE